MLSHPATAMAVVIGLIVIAMTATIGLIFSEASGHQPTPSLAAIAGMAVGALSSLLSVPGGRPFVNGQANGNRYQVAAPPPPKSKEQSHD